MKRYGAAMVLVVAAAIARAGLTPLIGPTALPFIFFFPAVAGAAWYGGLGPGVSAMAASVLLADWAFLAPVNRLSIPGIGDATALLAFIIGSGIIVAGPIEALRRARARLTQEIHDRTRAQRESSEARDLLQTTLASIGDAVIATDEAGRVTFANAEAEELTGWSAADSRGRELVEIFRIADEATGVPVEHPVSKVMKAGEAVALASHTILFSKDGTRVPIGDSAAPIRRPDGSLAGAVFVFRSVGAEREAQVVRARLAAIVESSGDGIASKNLDGRILTWNAGAERMFGYTADEIVGQSITLLIPRDRLGEEERIVDSIRRGRPFELLETVRVTKDGREIPVSVSVSPIKNQDGEVVGASKIVRDISELVAARAELARERELLATTLGSIGDAVVVTDSAGRLTFLNGAAERMTGWSAAEAAGHELQTVFRIINEHTHAVVENPVEKVLRLGTTVGLANHTILCRRDGTEIPIDDSAAPIRMADGMMAGVVLVFRDITERKRTENTQRDADRRKDEFLAILAHELRNPLAPIALAASMLRRIGPPQAELQQLRDVIERQAKQLARLLDDLLDVSRIGLGKITLHSNRLSLAVAVESAIEAVQPLVEARQHTLVVRPSPEPIEINGDLERLSQVFANLLNNAAKYTDPGGRIAVAIDCEDHQAVVRITDNGIGLLADHLSQIFEMFTQVDRSLERAQGGLGVGLSLSKRLVELHGGTITAHSEGLGLGSEFTVRLPALARQAPEREPAIQDARPAVTPARYRILVADDNPDSVHVLAQILGDLGHEVITAPDGLAALEQARAFDPDVVVLDIGMPKMNGYEVARRLRADALAKGRGVSLVAITGWGQDEDKRRAQTAGFDYHLTKPVDQPTINRLVADLSGKHRG